MKKAKKGKPTKKKVMIATWKDLDKELDVTNQEEETKVANLCFMANNEDEEIEVQVSKHEISYDELFELLS